MPALDHDPQHPNTRAAVRRNLALKAQARQVEAYFMLRGIFSTMPPSVVREVIYDALKAWDDLAPGLKRIRVNREAKGW